MPTPKTAKPPPRIQIAQPAPMIDCGRYPAKRTVGDIVDVSADIFADGHDVLRAVVRFCAPDSKRWEESPLQRIDAHVDGDRWAGGFTVDRLGRYRWTIEAWSDAFASWREELRRKIDAGQSDLKGELSEGEVLLEQAAKRAKGADRQRIQRAIACLREDDPKPQVALDPELYEIVERYPDRSRSTTMDAKLHVDVDPVRARFGTWYELFPRSWGGLRGVERQIPKLADARLRRRLPAAGPPDRPDEPQGRQQRAAGRARRSRVTVGDRRRDRRAQRAAPGPRHDRGLRRADRAPRRSTASRSRSTSRSSARPTTPG